MRLQFPSPSTTISLNDLGSIESNALEGVHGNEDDTTVGVYAVLCVSIPNGVKHCTQVGYLLNAKTRAEHAPEGSLR